MSALSSSCTRPAAAYSDPRGDLGARMQTQNTSRHFKILNRMRLSAPKKRNKVGGIHRAATRFPLEDVPAVARVLHGAVLRWLFFSRDSKCIFPGLFPKMQRKKRERGILLGYKTPLNPPGCKYMPVSLTVFHIFHMPDSTILASQSTKHHQKTQGLFSRLQTRRPPEPSTSLTSAVPCCKDPA